MTDGSPGWRIAALAVTMSLCLAALTAGLAGPAAAQSDGPTLDCVGSGGAAYATDSGLTVYENDTDGAADTFYFPDDETVRFEYQSDAVALSAAGNAAARLADGTGDATCLGDVDAADNAITIEPEDGTAVTLEGTFEALAVGPVDASAGDGFDLSYDASDPEAVIVKATALDDGTEVVALDEDGSELAETTVEDGTMRFAGLPAGEYRVDLAEPEANGGSTGSSGGGGGPSVDGAGDDDGPDVTVRTANVSQTTVETGETVTVNAMLATEGSRGSNYTVALHVDDQPVRNETLNVPADGTRTVTLTHSFDDPGEYALAIGNEPVGPVTVESAGTTMETTDGFDEPTDTANGTTTDTPASSPTERTTGGNGPGFDLAVALVALLALVALGLVARQR